MSRFPRIINVGTLAIQRKDTPTPTATIQVTCTATTFVLVDQVPPPAATEEERSAGEESRAAQKTE